MPLYKKLCGLPFDESKLGSYTKRRQFLCAELKAVGNVSHSRRAELGWGIFL